MTNIRTEDMWPHRDTLAEYHSRPCAESLTDLFRRRSKTYIGFAEIEKGKGLLRPKMSLSSSEGQEAVRILAQRGLEEMAEAYDSNERDHYLEELIDAINYFWILAILDDKAPLDEIIKAMADSLCGCVTDPNPAFRIGCRDIGHTLVSLNPVFEKLRHRAWMNTIQDPYFSGWPEIALFLADNLCLIYGEFRSWREFVQFFIAKDNVLKYRLATNY